MDLCFCSSFLFPSPSNYSCFICEWIEILQIFLSCILFKFHEHWLILFFYNILLAEYIKRNDILQTDFHWAIWYLYNSVWPIFILSILYKLYECMLIRSALEFLLFLLLLLGSYVVVVVFLFNSLWCRLIQ